MHWGTVWQELGMVMCSKGKGNVGVETHGKKEKEGENVAPIGIGRAWAWELGTKLNFTVIEKSVIESLNKFTRKTQTG